MKKWMINPLKQFKHPVKLNSKYPLKTFPVQVKTWIPDFLKGASLGQTTAGTTNRNQSRWCGLSPWWHYTRINWKSAIVKELQVDWSNKSSANIRTWTVHVRNYKGRSIDQSSATNLSPKEPHLNKYLQISSYVATTQHNTLPLGTTTFTDVHTDDRPNSYIAT